MSTRSEWIEAKRKERNVLFEGKKRYCDYIKVLGTEKAAMEQLKLVPETIEGWSQGDVKFPLYVQQAKQEAFLLKVRESGSVVKAAEFVGTDLMGVLGWAKNDQVFSTEWENLVKRIEKKNRITVESLIPKAIEVHEAAMDAALKYPGNPKVMAVGLHSGGNILKGTQTLDERPVVQVNNTVVTIADLIALAQQKEVRDGNG